LRDASLKAYIDSNKNETIVSIELVHVLGAQIDDTLDSFGKGRADQDTKKFAPTTGHSALSISVIVVVSVMSRQFGDVTFAEIR
jgi:hypothetical protein